MVVANTLAYYNAATVEGASGDKKLKHKLNNQECQPALIIFTVIDHSKVSPLTVMSCFRKGWKLKIFRNFWNFLDFVKLCFSLIWRLNLLSRSEFKSTFAAKKTENLTRCETKFFFPKIFHQWIEFSAFFLANFFRRIRCPNCCTFKTNRPAEPRRAKPSQLSLNQKQTHQKVTIHNKKLA